VQLYTVPFATKLLSSFRKAQQNRISTLFMHPVIH